MMHDLKTAALAALTLAAVATTHCLPAQSLLAQSPAGSAQVPAEDLAGQFATYLKELDASLADEAAYKAAGDKIKRVANTAAVLAWSLGKHDTKTDMGAKAPAIAASARRLAKASDYAAAKAELAGLHTALETAAGLNETPSGKVASLGQIMSEAELLNTRLRNSLRRFDKRRLADNARAAATLAAIAQASELDTHEVKDPKQLPDWHRLAGEMQAAAAELNSAIHAADKPGATAALGRLDTSCKACHKVFAPME